MENTHQEFQGIKSKECQLLIIIPKYSCPHKGGFNNIEIAKIIMLAILKTETLLTSSTTTLKSTIEEHLLEKDKSQILLHCRSPLLELEDTTCLPFGIDIDFYYYKENNQHYKPSYHSATPSRIPIVPLSMNSVCPPNCFTDSSSEALSIYLMNIYD